MSFASTAPQEPEIRKPNTEWVNIQKKTFTKWMNSHLKKVGTHVEDCQTEFQDGIKLMFLIKALYGIEMPKYNKNPKMRPQKFDNLVLAFNMIEQAQIKTNFLKTNHLADCDLKMILGMIWAIILDYQIKGISIEDVSAKEGLLLWCQKKTKGYRDVKVENFHNSWKDGMALCALIHRHRPDLIDYDSLDKANKKENLQHAFDVAQQHLGIYPLLDVEDICEVERPDEKSVMTYISEFFHKFSSQDQAEVAARRIQKFVEFHQQVERMEQNYMDNAKELLEWINKKIEVLDQRDFETSYEKAKELILSHKEYKVNEKQKWTEFKLDNETLFQNIQIRLRSNNRRTWSAPEGLSPDDIDTKWQMLFESEKNRGKALRENLIAAKDNLKKQFADQANDFVNWLEGIKKDVLESSGTLQEQLDIVNAKDNELNNDDRVTKLDETNKQVEEAGIDENPYTDYAFDEMQIMYDQVKNATLKKKQFLENQLNTSNRKGISPEKLEEFRETFRHFDKDHSNSLDKLEFKACLTSLNQSLSDEKYEKLWNELSGGGSKVEFDKFLDYMIKITEDADNSEQIRDSFKMLSNYKDTITASDLAVHPLEETHIDYLKNNMPGSDDQYDYKTFVDSCFSE